MGIRRLGKRRLAAIEKRGILKDVGASSAMSEAVISATQQRQGQMVTTEIVLDLGSSTAGLKTQATAEAFPIGTTTTAASYVCQVTNPVFGLVTAVDVVCLEAVSDGTLTDFDVKYATGDNGNLNTEATTGVSIKEGVGAKGYHETAAYDLQQLKNKYIYVTSGAATGQKASATIDLSAAVAGNVTTGVTTVRLINSDGNTAVAFVADSSIAWDEATPAANKFGIGASAGTGTPAMDSAKKLTYAISHAINRNGAFATDALSRDKTGGANDNSAEDNLTSITVTHAASTATSNHDNYLVNDDPQTPTGITVGAFTGGIDDGQAMASGKLLLRFTGFMAFDDV